MRYKGAILVAIFILGITLIYLLSDTNPVSSTRLYQGSDAPQFDLIDTNNKSWKLSELKGKVILLNFWATWCDTCKEEKPFFNNLYEELKENKEVVFLTVLYNDDIQKAIDYVNKNSFKFPIIEDKRKIAHQFGIRGVPETFVIDKKGKIAQKIVGPMKWDSPDVKSAIIRLTKS
ncbi:MAG: TlpA family protein disulfide reductase [Thermodesulfovibrionales bacterium]|nr:TlpA family protein disulfide reductase [Thermodesulfovibrionales bacterium]